MAIEVERKFLVTSDGWKQFVSASEEFGQGYLAAADNCLVRVRVGKDRAWLTLKGRDQQLFPAATDLATQAGFTQATQAGFTQAAQAESAEGATLRRLEFEYEIPKDQGQQMLTQMSYAALEKIRFFLDLTPYAWTVDVFTGAHQGLVLLEIEGSGVEHLRRADLPAWVGDEVSTDPQYANANLALQTKS